MSEHKATIEWTRGVVDFGIRNYSRNHTWRFSGGVETPASAAPGFLGDPSRVDPEAALVAALSSCHMLTFLAVASRKGFIVDSYEDNAIGWLEKNAAGKLAVTRIELRPKIAFSGDKQPTPADLDEMHHKAHEDCFIANSITAAVSVKAPD